MSDPDDFLTPYERTRRALHRAVDRIVFAWPHALIDADARGFPEAVMQPHTGESELTSVERAALKPCRAVGWLAEFGDVARYLTGWDSFAYNQRIALIVTARMHETVDVFTWADEAWVQRIITLGNKAALWWPPGPSKGAVVQGVTVGERGNDVETCTLCGEPAPAGRDETTGQPLIKRIDGEPFHTSPCYFRVWRQRRRVA